MINIISPKPWYIYIGAFLHLKRFIEFQFVQRKAIKKFRNFDKHKFE